MQKDLTTTRTAEGAVAPLAKLPAIILLALGLPTILFGIYRAAQTYGNISSLELAQGTVAANEIRSRPDPEGSRIPIRTNYVVVSYSTRMRQAQQFAEATGNSPSEYSLGDTVQVLYDPEAPSHVFLKSWKNTWEEPATFLVLGILPMLVLLVWGAWTIAISKGRQP